MVHYCSTSHIRQEQGLNTNQNCGTKKKEKKKDDAHKQDICFCWIKRNQGSAANKYSVLHH